MRKTLILSSAVLVASAFFAWAANSPVIQSGTVTPGHVVSWTQTGIVQDAGTSVTANATTFGITANGGTPFCISTAKNPAARVQLCLGVTAGSVAGIYLNSYNGAAIVPFNIVVNGVSYTFPNNNPALGVFRQVASGSSDTATSLDATVAWASATAAPKTETLYACGAGAKGNTLTIADEQGNASTYPITLAPGGGNTVLGVASFVMNYDRQSMAIICDGAGNWIAG